MRALRARKLRFCLGLRVSRTRLCHHVLRYHRVAECARGATLPKVVAACCTRPRSMSSKALQVMAEPIENALQLIQKRPCKCPKADLKYFQKPFPQMFPMAIPRAT